MESLGEVLKRAQLIRQEGVPRNPAPEVCQICAGAGYLRYDVTADDPRFGELVACECTIRELERRRVERLLETSNLGDHRKQTFDSFILKIRDGDPPDRTPDAAWRRAKAYAESPSGWLVLYGAFGTGKTHLAAAIANYRLAQTEPVVFMGVPDLLDHLRSTFRPDSDVTYDEQFEMVRNTDLLILDDLGTQTTTPWAQEKLYQILNHRYNKELPTVITTNLNPDEIEPRLRSRIGDSRLSKLCHVGGIDKRLGMIHPAQRQAPYQQGRSPRKLREDDRL